MVEIAFERVQNPWVGGKMITESRDTIEGKKKKKKRGGGQRGNRAENIRSYYRHPIKEEGGGRRAAGIVPMVYIYRLKSSFPYLFPLLLLCLVRLCARVHDKNWKVSLHLPLTFSRGRKISQRIFDPSTLRARWSLIAVIDQFSNDLQMIVIRTRKYYEHEHEFSFNRIYIILLEYREVQCIHKYMYWYRSFFLVEESCREWKYNLR